MQKNELKAIVEEMNNNLLDSIDNQSKVTKEQVANYLRDAAQIISNVNEDSVKSLDYTKYLFSNAYKDIAKKSISSYASTSSVFQDLTDIHKETLDKYSHHINVPALKNKFIEIQGQMTQEVEKANEIITQLTNQVKTLEAESNIDSLTKIFNRRALSSYLNNICTKTTSINELHVLVIDIDDFKVINDEHGHIAGDKILIFIANILKRTLRDGDKIFRFGGEEFVITLNRIDDEQCMEVTKRLLKLVSENKLIYKNSNLSVTISIGTTKLINGDTPDSLISRADKALYRAKNNGKNQMYTEVTNGN